MSTRAQRAANRRNAQTSTGPITDAGKQTCSQNSRTHGCSSPEFSILPAEDPNDFDRLIERITIEMQPHTEHENFLVGLMAQARWKRGRIQNHEMDLLDQLIAGEPVEAKIALMMRYAAASERAYYKAHREFTQSRRQRVHDQQAAADAAYNTWATTPIGQGPSLSTLFPGFREPAPPPTSASFGKTAGAAALRV
jgi:hypothetical protein